MGPDNLVQGLKLKPFLVAKSSVCKDFYLQFLPIGETLIIPFRNSINVPLW